VNEYDSNSTVLEQEGASDVGFVLHCFGGDLNTAQRCVQLGGMVSFTGVVTFKNASALRTVVRELPLTSLMLETDCPYMAPVPYRGKRNEPAYVIEVARLIASEHALSLEEVARTTTDNALQFFHLR